MPKHVQLASSVQKEVFSPPVAHCYYCLHVPPGLRGAIAYALALNLQESVGKFATPETIRVLDTATLIIVLFTIVCLGASTLPLLKVSEYYDDVDVYMYSVHVHVHVHSKYMYMYM